MKSDRDSTRIIRSWLEDGVTVLPDRVLDAVEESLHATPQRRAGWLSRLFPTRGSNRVRFGLAAAAVVVAAILGSVSVLPRDVGGPPAPTAEPTSDTLTLASGTFTAQFGEVDIDATARGATRSGQGIGAWIVSGEMEVTNDGGRFLVHLRCTRTNADGLVWIGGDIAESTHEDAVDGERVAIVFESGTPVESVLWFEDEQRAPSCDAFLEGAPGVAEFLEPIRGEVHLSPALTDTPTRLRIGVQQRLEAGTYTLSEDFPVRLTFVLPDGWENCSGGPHEQGVCPSGSAGVSSGISFLIVDNVVAEPCRRALLDPPVGPTVDELVAAIVGLEGFDSTTPAEVTVDGYDGKQLEVTAPPRAPCQLLTWATSARTNGVAPGEHNLLRIVDVAGTRVVIAAAFPGVVSAEERSVIVQIVESVRFDR